jgi:hypothetical protein
MTPMYCDNCKTPTKNSNFCDYCRCIVGKCNDNICNGKCMCSHEDYYEDSSDPDLNCTIKCTNLLWSNSYSECYKHTCWSCSKAGCPTCYCGNESFPKFPVCGYCEIKYCQTHKCLECDQYKMPCDTDYCLAHMCPICWNLKESNKRVCSKCSVNRVVGSHTKPAISM